MFNYLRRKYACMVKNLNEKLSIINIYSRDRIFLRPTMYLFFPPSFYFSFFFLFYKKKKEINVTQIDIFVDNY